MSFPNLSQIHYMHSRVEMMIRDVQRDEGCTEDQAWDLLERVVCGQVLDESEETDNGTEQS